MSQIVVGLTSTCCSARHRWDRQRDAAIDKMIARAQDARCGLIGQLTARMIERALGAEMDDHLGYVHGDPAGNGSGISRNGSFRKTITTTSGPARIAVPRDRKSAFEQQIVVKRQRRVGQVDEMILSLYARGMTIGTFTRTWRRFTGWRFRPRWYRR